MQKLKVSVAADTVCRIKAAMAAVDVKEGIFADEAEKLCYFSLM